MSLGGGRLFEGWLRCNHSPGLLLRLIAKPLKTPDNTLASFNSNGACNCQSEREAVDAEYTTRHGIRLLHMVRHQCISVPWATGVSKVLEEPSFSSYRVLPQSTCLKAEVQVSKTQGTGLRLDLTMWPCWPYLRSCTLSFAAGSWAVLHA